MALHFTPEQIRKFNQHQCSPAELQEMNQHLTACAACEQKLGYTTRVETGVAFLKSWLAPIDEPPVEHLSSEKLLAYIGNRLDAIERELVESHAQGCVSCDLQLKELAAFAARQTHPPAKGPQFFSFRLADWFQRLFQFPTISTFRWQPGLVGLLLLVTCTFAWFFWFQANPSQIEPIARQAEPLIQEPSVENRPSLPTESSGKKPSATVIPPRLLPNPRRSSEKTKIPSNLVTLLPRQYREAFFQPGTLLGSPSQEPEIRIVGPWMTFVPETRPILRWETGNLSGTTIVTLFDAQYNQVAQSPLLSGTSWEVPVELAPGQFYSWEISITQNGKTVVAPLPPSPEARFKVLSQVERKSLEGHLEKAGTEPLKRGLALVQAGCVDAAEREFAQLPPTHPQAAAVRKLVRTLRQSR